MRLLRMIRYYRDRGYTWRNAVTTAWKMTK